MAHKARRRPSWKKYRRRDFSTSRYRRWSRKKRNAWNDIMESLNEILQDEINKEILAKLNEVKHDLPTMYAFGEEITYDRVDFKTRYDIDKKEFGA